MIENPYSLHPAIGKYFVGRAHFLADWRERLTPDSEPWRSGKSWMVVGKGGLGKTSLFHELIYIAKDKYKAHTISIDLGLLREIGDTKDLFDTLSIEMPDAKLPGTKVRKWFGLQPDAPLGDLVGQITGELLNQVTSFTIELAGGKGIKLGSFRKKPNEIEGTAHRLAQFLVNLTLLSEEQDSPVIVFLDQLGKCHDHPTWVYIAGMFLELCKKIRFSGINQVLFVVSLRPEQEGLLRHHIDRRLFENDIFTPIDLLPLSMDEAIKAITIRGEPYINSNLARQIMAEIGSRGPLDPYTIQLSSMAVWNHICGGEQWHSPAELEEDVEKLRTIIREGSADIVQSFMQEPTQWDILVRLAQSRGGLTASQIQASLSREHNLSTLEVKSAIDSLVNPPRTGYRLLTVNTERDSPDRFSLAHDLLRDYILSIIPDEQRRINQANRILEYGYWRFQENEMLLSDWELQLLWDVHSDLNLIPDYWDLIINSELPCGSQRLFLWYQNYPKEIEVFCRINLHDKHMDTSNIRFFLFSWFIERLIIKTQTHLDLHTTGVENEHINVNSTSDIRLLDDTYTAMSILAEQARNNEDIVVRLRATEALEELGDTDAALSILADLAWNNEDVKIRLRAVEDLGRLGDKEAALPILVELARNNENVWVRLRATEELDKLGDKETALSILGELARNDMDVYIHLLAAEDLGRLGDKEGAVPILAKLARNYEKAEIRLRATKGLVELGDTDTALPILAKLAWNYEDPEVQRRACEALVGLGKVALPILAGLAQNYKKAEIRLRATKGLVELGDMDTALPILAKLARNNEDLEVQQRACEALVGLGKVALPILAELARNNENVKIRLRATKGLVELGDKEMALSILANLAKKNKNEYNRIRAAEVLGKLGDKETALSILADLARNNEDVGICLRAAEGLVELGDRNTALPILVKLARNTKIVRVRLQAAEVLGKSGDKKTALSILADLALNNEDVEIRLRATESLVELGETDTALPILDELARNNEDLDVQQRACEALVGLGRVVLPILAELARNNENVEIRLRAAVASGKLGDKETALSILADLAQSNEDLEIRLRVAEGLVELGDTDTAIPILAKLARNNEYLEIQQCTCDALVRLGKTALPIVVELSRLKKNEQVRWRVVDALWKLHEVSIQELFTIAVVDPFSNVGGIATIMLIINIVPDFSYLGLI